MFGVHAHCLFVLCSTAVVSQSWLRREGLPVNWKAMAMLDHNDVGLWWSHGSA